MTLFYARAVVYAGGWNFTLLTHLIDAPDGQPIPWTARCGAICGWRSAITSTNLVICPECEARP